MGGKTSLEKLRSECQTLLGKMERPVMLGKNLKVPINSTVEYQQIVTCSLNFLYPFCSEPKAAPRGMDTCFCCGHHACLEHRIVPLCQAGESRYSTTLSFALDSSRQCMEMRTPSSLSACESSPAQRLRKRSTRSSLPLKDRQLL